MTSEDPSVENPAKVEAFLVDMLAGQSLAVGLLNDLIRLQLGHAAVEVFKQIVMQTVKAGSGQENILPFSILYEDGETKMRLQVPPVVAAAAEALGETATALGGMMKQVFDFLRELLPPEGLRLGKVSAEVARKFPQDPVGATAALTQLIDEGFVVFESGNIKLPA